MFAKYRLRCSVDITDLGLTVCSGVPASEDYGSHLFKGAVADSYLSKQGLPAGLLDDPSWTKTSADKVAAAVMEWANDKGASVFTHWFQPLGASGFRHGMSGQVHNAMFVFGKDGKPQWSLSGKELLKGETDGSSYPSGGMRATHTAGGYTILDPTGPLAFVLAAILKDIRAFAML